jgi:hypothetical protein
MLYVVDPFFLKIEEITLYLIQDASKNLRLTRNLKQEPVERLQ